MYNLIISNIFTQTVTSGIDVVPFQTCHAGLSASAELRVSLVTILLAIGWIMSSVINAFMVFVSSILLDIANKLTVFGRTKHSKDKNNLD